MELREFASLRDALAREHEVVRGIVLSLSDQEWDMPTASPGWSVRDQIGHLAYYDEAAAVALSSPARFEELFAGTTQQQREQSHLDKGRTYNPAELMRWYCASQNVLIAAAKALPPSARVPWYGPSMSAASFVTARLMETWAHGWDAAEALGKPFPPTVRLKHIADLGIRARQYSYEVRGLNPPQDEVRVELTGPKGERWFWGSVDAPNLVSGSALEFCLVMIRRRRFEDTSLVAEGESATTWLRIAQAFAGAPGPQRTLH